MPNILASQSAIPLPSAELNLGGTSTSQLNFLTTAASGGVASGSPVMLRLPGSSVVKNRPFRVRAAGRCGGTTNNFTAKINLGNNSTAGSNTNLATSGAIAMTAAGGTWELVMDCMWDSTSTKIQGKFNGRVGATAKTDTILADVTQTWDATTEYDLTSTQTTGVLTVSGTFATGSASNYAYCDVFEVEVL